MVKNRKILEDFENEMVKETDINENFKIFEEMLKFAKKLGKFPPKNPLEDIEIDIKYASAINGIREGFIKKEIEK